MTPIKFSEKKKETLRTNLIDWFDSNKREFPWRKTKNPFHILVAEKLLQQTKARDYVVDIYRNIIEKYPTPKELANADLKELKKDFSKIGLYHRAKHLIKLSREIIEKFDSKVPKNYDELISLTGVGEYTARAVLNFSYNERVVIVDINIARFLYRYFSPEFEFPKNPTRSKELYKLAENIIPEKNSNDFIYALLDFCAAICVAGTPKCSICPVSNNCAYFKKIKEHNP